MRHITALETKSLGNGRWTVVDAEGRRSGPVFGNRLMALRYIDKHEKRRELVKRKCMTCSKAFMSDGPGHRMCSWCRDHRREIHSY